MQEDDYLQMNHAVIRLVYVFPAPSTEEISFSGDHDRRDVPVKQPVHEGSDLMQTTHPYPLWKQDPEE